MFGADTSQANAKVCSLITKKHSVGSHWLVSPSFKIKHVQYLQNTTQTILGIFAIEVLNEKFPTLQH